MSQTTPQSLDFSSPFKISTQKDNHDQSIVPQGLDNISPHGLNGDLIVNGNFSFLADNFFGWDVVSASYSGLDNVGALLNPISGYSIKQDVSGDPTRYYKVTFQATIQLQDTSANIDGYVRIEIVDKVTGNVLLDKTEFANNTVTPRYYNVTGIGEAEVRFYAIGRSISLLGVSICDGPLMYSNRVNNVIIDDFTHSYDGWVVSPIVQEFADMHQDFDLVDGLALSPSNTDFKLQSVLTVNKTTKRIDIHQPFIDEISGVLLNNTEDIKDIDFGYENGILTFYYCTGINSSNPIKKFNSSGVVSSLQTSSGYNITALKKELNGNKLWFYDNNINRLHVVDLSNAAFPTTIPYLLDINVKAIAHDSVANEIYSIGQDMSFLPAIKSSVYKTEVNNFNITTKIFTTDGLYTSIECVESQLSFGLVNPVTGRIIIGGDRSIPFGSGPDDNIIIVLDRNGVIDYSLDLPEVQNVSDISAIQIADGRRPGIALVITDSTLGQVFTLDVRNAYRYRHYYTGDCVASLQPIFHKAPRATQKTFQIDPTKWYVIDTDVISDAWPKDGTGPAVWRTPVMVSTSDNRLKNADIGQTGFDIFAPNNVEIGFKRQSDNLATRILYRPSSDSMTMILDSGDAPFNIGLDPRFPDNAYFARVHGVSISEIDLNAITPISTGQIKEIFTFDNDAQGWTSDASLYDSNTQSLRIPASVGPNGAPGDKLSKTFNVRKFKKVKIAINYNARIDPFVTEYAGVAVNGVSLFENITGEYNNIINKTGYFEAEFTSQVDQITIDIFSSNGKITTNYIAVVYSEPNDLFDPCAFQDVRTSITFLGVPFIPYNFYGFALKYTLRDYEDPLIRGTVTVPQLPINLSVIGGQPFLCYGWSQNPVYPAGSSTGQIVDGLMLSTASASVIVDVLNNTNIIHPRRNDFSTTPGNPPLNISFPLYYQNIPDRIVSGNPICTQHEDSQFFKPCVVESIELLSLMASAPNLPKSYSLFGTGCGPLQIMNINLSYLKDGETLRTSFNTTFNLSSALQVMGSGSQPPNNQDNGMFWDVGVPARMPQARWESFKVDLDLPSGDGADQCTEPIEGFVINGTADFYAGDFVMDQTGNGGGGGGGVCTVEVIVQIVSDGSSGPAVVRIELKTPDDGTWRIVYGNETTADITPSLPWNATAQQIQLALSGLFNLNSSLVSVIGQFPVYVITFDSSLGIIPDITIINNLTCISPPLGFVNPGPYDYNLPKPGPNIGGGNNVDLSCKVCLPNIINTVKLHRESISAGCFDDNCASPIKTMACRFVKDFNRFEYYKFYNNSLISIGLDYVPIPGDNIVLLDNSIGLAGAPLDKISRSFLYV